MLALLFEVHFTRLSGLRFLLSFVIASDCTPLQINSLSSLFLQTGWPRCDSPAPHGHPSADCPVSL